MRSLHKKLFLFSKLVGGLPVKWITGPEGAKRLSFSSAGFLWSVILFTVQELLSSIVVCFLFTETLLHKTSKFVAILDVVCLQVVAAVVFLSGARKYRKLVCVFDILKQADSQLAYTTPEVKVTVRSVVASTTTAIFLITVNTLFLMKHYFDNRVEFGEMLPSVLGFFPIILLFCSQVAVFVHFRLVTHSFTNSFRTINASIKKEIINNITERMNITLAAFDFNDTTRSVSSKIMKLKTLMNTYWLLCDAVHQANVFYGDQLLVILFSSFLHVTVKSYFFLLQLGDGNLLATISEGSWILALICYTVLLINSSTDVTDSANETGSMICKLINSDLDSELTTQLEGFLLQLRHHKARFSALGIFQVDNKTITVMAAAVTTYLVILIQFHS